MNKLKILGHALMVIPLAIIFISAIVSTYVYYTKSYPLTIFTPITFFVVTILWIIGLFLVRKSNLKEQK